jgi:glycosyltransferase involved in cell wall biosynthesis
MDGENKIGVVVPAYNASKYIRATLDSIQTQQNAAFQCIVVDDGSNDNTLEIANDYSRRDHRFQAMQQANQGVAIARNAGAARLSGCSYYLFCDSDDALEPDALHKLQSTLERRREISAVTGTTIEVDSDGIETGNLFHANRNRRRIDIRDGRIVETANGDICFRYLIAINPVTTSGLMVRAGAVDFSNFFDPYFTPCEDWQAWVKLSAHAPIGFIDTTIVRYRVHSNSLSQNNIRMHRGANRVRSYIHRLVSDANHEHVASSYISPKQHAKFQQLFAASLIKSRVDNAINNPSLSQIIPLASKSIAYMYWKVLGVLSRG